MDFDRATLHAAIEGAVSGHPEIAAAYLYGSAARGTATALSDVDRAFAAAVYEAFPEL